MTDLNKLLNVAKKVWPKYCYQIESKDLILGVILGSEDFIVVEPHKPTERGKAQLMDIVFAIAKKVDGYEYKEYELIQYLASDDRESIINLAAEVL